jgi:putative membrane protein
MSNKFFLYLAFFLLVISSLISLTTPDIYDHNFFSFIPIVAILSLEVYKRNLRPALSLLLVAFAIGTLAEAQGLAYGTIFGSRYEYAFTPWLSFFSVPFQVGTFWAIFYYLSHVVVNTLDRSKSLIRLCLLDAALMTGIDLLLDPVMVAKGAWHWFGTGPYFGIPTGNFVGWFLVSLIISFVIRKISKIKIVDKAHFALLSLSFIIALLLIDLVRISV